MKVALPVLLVLAAAGGAAQAQPQRFNAMLKAYNDWAEAQGVLPVADDYHQGRTVMLKGILNRPGLLATVALLFLLPLLLLVALVVWLFRRRRTG